MQVVRNSASVTELCTIDSLCVMIRTTKRYPKFVLTLPSLDENYPRRQLPNASFSRVGVCKVELLSKLT